jgi:hypothetical protein
MRNNLIDLQTLLHFSIGIGEELSYSHIMINQDSVMSTLTAWNKCTFYHMRKSLPCDGKIYTQLNKP